MGMRVHGECRMGKNEEGGGEVDGRWRGRCDGVRCM